MKILTIIGILCILWSCQQDLAVSPEDQKVPGTISSQDETQFLKGIIRIKVTEELAKALENKTDSISLPTRFNKIDQTIKSLGAISVKRTFPPAGRFEARSRREELHLWYDVRFDSTKLVTRAFNDFSTLPGIVIVEARPRIRLIDTGKTVLTELYKVLSSNELPFNDPGLALQWHYHNDGTIAENFRQGCDINVFDAWKYYIAGKQDVIVSVVDGGIDYTHEDLSENIWINPGEIDKNGIDDDNNGYKDDIHGYNFVTNNGKLFPHDHGTHVAGTIGAVNNNGKGVCGIAGGDGIIKGVKLMSCQIFNDEEDIREGSVNSAAAIKYGADNGAVISQNSWGYEEATFIPSSDKAAIDYFIKYAGIDENGNQTGPMQGGIVIFAAGNEDREIGYPSSYENVVAVASVGPDYTRAYYSNYGNWVDVTAPGGSSYYTKGQIYSTLPGNKYGYLQGTSMACPHVSGVAALILSKYGKAGFTTEMLKKKLVESAVNIDSYNSGYGHKLGAGLVNATLALAKGSTSPPEPVQKIWGEVNSNTVVLRWIVTSDPDDTKAAGYAIYYDTEPVSTIDPSQLPTDIKIKTIETKELDVGDTIAVSIPNLEFEKNYYFVIDGYDFSGNHSALSSSFSIQTGVNTPPVIIPYDGTDITLKSFEIKKLTFEIKDPENHEINWQIDKGSEAVEAIQDGEKIIVTINGTKVSAGSYKGKISVSDLYGATASLVFHYTILSNHSPKVLKQPGNIQMYEMGEQIELPLDEYITDEDGEPLNYTVTLSNPVIAHLSVNQNKLYITAMSYGTTEVTLVAKDAVGEKCSLSFEVSVWPMTQKEITLFPNPVKDYLNIRSKAAIKAEVIFYNSLGIKSLQTEIETSSHTPAQLDVKFLEGGSYVVIIKYEGKEIKNNIVKL